MTTKRGGGAGAQSRAAQKVGAKRDGAKGIDNVLRAKENQLSHHESLNSFEEGIRLGQVS